MIPIVAPVLSTYLLRPTVGIELFGGTFPQSFSALFMPKRICLSTSNHALALILCSTCVGAYVHIEVILVAQDRI
jgi:hypothetical protein